jgi:hypothetical protein
MFPMQVLPECLRYTNASAREDPGNEWWRAEITGGDVLQAFGIILAMCADPRRGKRKAYWNTHGEGVRQAANYGLRFGVSRDRFLYIMKHLRWSDKDTPTREVRTVN